MTREQEKIRKENVYKVVKSKLANKSYSKNNSEIYKEVALIFGYEPRSVSNIYYQLRKQEEKNLNKIRVSKKQSIEIAQWFTEYVTKWYDLKLNTNSNSKLEDNFTVNLFANPNEYSFDFSIDVYYNVVITGDGKNEPIERDVVINDYILGLTAVYNDEGEELIIRQKDVQEIEEHLHSNLKLSIDYYPII